MNNKHLSWYKEIIITLLLPLEYISFNSILTEERTASTAVFGTSKPPPRSHFWHCRWFLGCSTWQSMQARCPPLHCTNQSNNTSIKKPAPCSISRTDEVYSNLIHWMISPSSCTTISRLGPGYYKAYRHIFYTPSVPKCTPSVRNYLSQKWMYLELNTSRYIHFRDK